MNRNIRLIPSGFDFVDKNWGGIYRGGSYLVIGARKTGRTLLGLKFALEAAQNKEVCLYFTNMRPKDLMIQAASLNFDIQAYMNSNRIIVVRVGNPEEIYNLPNPDRYLAEYIKDIVTVVEKYRPTRMVFDELTPYIGFKRIQTLRDTFLHTLEFIEEKDVTSLFIVGEPATEKAEALVNTIGQYVTGVFSLKKSVAKFDNKYFGGTLQIIPNVGHTEGQFEFKYQIEPLRGVIVVEDEKSDNHLHGQIPVIKKSPKAKEYGITNKHSNSTLMPTYSFSDFKLILNNQIALFRSTKQMFSLVAFKFDSTVYQGGLLTSNQFQSAISNSMEKKDKLCFNEDYFYVLQVRSDENSLTNLLSNLVQNLSNKDAAYLENIGNHIWFFNKAVDSEDLDADKLLLNVLANTSNFVSLNSFVR